ncbi:hypothetical protein C8J57DRAFT_1218991 [Mycena rebaudengoi]|nr:hypothetical protein C8J57DRAFT_1218991 [Mycena rebaudengoi]
MDRFDRWVAMVGDPFNTGTAVELQRDRHKETGQNRPAESDLESASKRRRRGSITGRSDGLATLLDAASAINILFPDCPEERCVIQNLRERLDLVKRVCVGDAVVKRGETLTLKLTNEFRQTDKVQRVALVDGYYLVTTIHDAGVLHGDIAPRNVLLQHVCEIGNENENGRTKKVVVRTVGKDPGKQQKKPRISSSSDLQPFTFCTTARMRDA